MELYTSLQGQKLLLEPDDEKAVSTDEFYISIPNRSLSQVELTDAGSFTYAYKYGRTPGRISNEYVKRVPITQINLGSSAVEMIQSKMPDVWRRILLFNLQSPRLHGIPVSERLKPWKGRPRIRDLGIQLGILQTGPLNAITDVSGVRVGHQTLNEGDTIRTGVTAILPHGGNVFQEKVPASVYIANAFGKAAGFLQVQELGNIETPIVLTDTLSVGTAVKAVVAWTLRRPGNESVRSVNAVVGETNCGYLSDIRKMSVTEEDVWAAIEAAEDGPVEEGCVGAGMGTMAFGWKGGIGTASRVLPESLGGYTVGVLVQSNFGGVLTIKAAPVGEILGRYAYKDQIEEERNNNRESMETPSQEKGSCMMVIATDAPLSSRNLERMARRAPLGLARTGSFVGNGSGDFVIVFSTRNLISYNPINRIQSVEEVHNNSMSPLFLAVVEAVEEAVYNSMFKATTTTGFMNRTVEALPIDPLLDIFSRRN